MNRDEKVGCRQAFKYKIQTSDGQAFEDLFILIMSYAEKEFKPIKPWGSIGDRKNDGYIKSSGTFFQVYAPENIERSYYNTVKKIHSDFEGLIKQWNPVKNFYFVINDKYKGVNADAEQAMQQIKQDYNLDNAEILIAKDLENILFEKLDDDQIISVVEMFPNLDLVIKLEYSILNEVIDHIMKLPLNATIDEKIIVPNWEKKIAHNNLSNRVKILLDNASLQLFDLERYLSNNSNFCSSDLQIKLNEVYNSLKDSSHADILFFSILNELSPRKESRYQNAVLVIMAKYFEVCDIFEEPKREGET